MVQAFKVRHVCRSPLHPLWFRNLDLLVWSLKKRKKEVFFVDWFYLATTLHLFYFHDFFHLVRASTAFSRKTVGVCRHQLLLCTVCTEGCTVHAARRARPGSAGVAYLNIFILWKHRSNVPKEDRKSEIFPFNFRGTVAKFSQGGSAWRGRSRTGSSVSLQTSSVETAGGENAF